MEKPSIQAVIDFEVYLLMTMKLRMSMAGKESLLEAKLAEHGLKIDQAQNIYQRVTESLGDEASRFDNIKKLLGIASPDTAEVQYCSVLWPSFDFNATASE